MIILSSFQAFKKKKSCWQEWVLITIPMALMVVPRVATLSMSMAISPKFGFSIIVGILAIVCASCGPYYKIDPRKVFIGAVSSICAPCMILHDHTYFYLVVNFTCSTLLTILSCILPVLMYYNESQELQPVYNCSQNTTNGLRRPCILTKLTKNEVSLFFS